MDDDELRCPDCEYTPGGNFAYPCEACECPECHHLAHDADDGCGHPDPHTGWCECDSGTTDEAQYGLDFGEAG